MKKIGVSKEHSVYCFNIQSNVMTKNCLLVGEIYTALYFCDRHSYTFHSYYKLFFYFLVVFYFIFFVVFL